MKSMGTGKMSRYCLLHCIRPSEEKRIYFYSVVKVHYCLTVGNLTKLDGNQTNHIFLAKKVFFKKRGIESFSRT